MQKPPNAEITHWQQRSLLTVEEGALFLSGIDDPIGHEIFITGHDAAYDHFMATKHDEVCLNVRLIGDAIESKRITATPETTGKGNQLDWNTKIPKTEFVEWCKSNGRIDVVRLLVPTDGNAFAIQNKDNMAERDTEIVRRHRQYHSQGMKNPTQQVAEEFGISPVRVRQIVQKCNKQKPESLNVVNQLKANAKLKR